MSRPGPDARLDIEWIAIKAGLKPGNRVSIDADRVHDLERRAQREGFTVERAAQMVEFPGRPPSVILYIAPDPERARQLREAEAPLLPPHNDGLAVDRAIPLHAELGLLLGFPDCCVSEFGTRLRRGVTRRAAGGDAHEDFVAAECAIGASKDFLGRLNDLSPDRRVRIITFYPCRYDCPSAASYAAGVFAAAEKTNFAASRALREALLGEMRIAVNGRRGAEAAAPEETVAAHFSAF